MTFRWIAPCDGVGRICTARIIGKGDIEWDSATELERFLNGSASKQLARVPTRGMEICFDSVGGDLQGAIRLGQVIHSLNMDTCLEPQYDDLVEFQRTPRAGVIQPPAPAVCASACVFALAAGVHRTVSKGALIGMHRFVGQGGDLGQHLTQVAVSELAQYLDAHGVQRNLLDVAARVPNSMVRYLTPQEILSTNLDNTGQIYQTWKLGAWPDGSVYAYVRQRNSVTDSWTALTLYKERGQVKLKIAFYPVLEEAIHMETARGSLEMADANEVTGRLTLASVWIRLDDEELAEYPKSRWIRGSGEEYTRTVPMEIGQAIKLQHASMLELWVMLPQIDARQNPSMAFQLNTLKPLLPAVLK